MFPRLLFKARPRCGSCAELGAEIPVFNSGRSWEPLRGRAGPGPEPGEAAPVRGGSGRDPQVRRERGCAGFTRPFIFGSHRGPPRPALIYFPSGSPPQSRQQRGFRGSVFFLRGGGGQAVVFMQPRVGVRLPHPSAAHPSPRCLSLHRGGQRDR